MLKKKTKRSRKRGLGEGEAPEQNKKNHRMHVMLAFVTVSLFLLMM